MFGYFGKSYVAPSPSAPPTEAGNAAQNAEIAVEDRVETRPVFEPSFQREAPESTAPEPKSAPSENDEIRSHLRELQRAVAAKRAKKEAQVKAVRSLHAKQAAYGRDTTQKRAKKAGYVTESEKIMGGQTGYGNYGNYSTLGQTLATAATDVTNATKVVERLTKDVKNGMATKSELAAAMADLDMKIKAATTLGKQAGELKGYGEEKKGFSPFLILIALGALYFFFLRPKG